MNDIREDSVFVLRLIMIIAGFLMFCYSKIGTYIFVQTGAFGYCLYLHYKQSVPFLKLFITGTLIISVLFEIFYPILARHTQHDYLSVKEEFDNAKSELERRRSGVNDEL
jgi:hypothetical protein